MSSGQLNLRTVKLGDNADASKNFLIQVPAVADGTLTISRENGTHILDIDAAGRMTVLGNVQTWQDVKTTPGRVLGAIYTNNTPLPIKVSLGGNAIGASGFWAVVIGGATTGYATAGYATGAVVGFFFEVPAGVTYQVNNGGSGITLSTWLELR